MAAYITMDDHVRLWLGICVAMKDCIHDQGMSSFLLRNHQIFNPAWYMYWWLYLRSWAIGSTKSANPPPPTWTLVLSMTALQVRPDFGWYWHLLTTKCGVFKS